MTNATSYYAPESTSWAIPKLGAGKKSKTKTTELTKKLSRDDLELVAALEAVKGDMDFLHNCFDQATDAILIDSLSYEIMAVNLRYKYYLDQCKEKGIVHGFGR